MNHAMTRVRAAYNDATEGGKLKLWHTAKNVVTLNGHQRVQDASEQYGAARVEHLALHRRATLKQQRLQRSIALLGVATRLSMHSLSRSFRLLSASGTYQQRKLNATVYLRVPMVGAHMVGAHMAGKALAILPTEVHMAGGALLGYGTATGSWALMTMAGSTAGGTALSSLSGAAAYNATMAAFGGGSLASGGLGVAGGAWVLGGLAVIPAVAAAAVTTHRKADEINQQRRDMEAASAKLRLQVSEFQDLGRSAEVSRLVVLRHWSMLEVRFRIARKALWPYGLFSRLKWLVFKPSMLTSHQQAALAHLDDAVARYCQLFNADEVASPEHSAKQP